MTRLPETTRYVVVTSHERGLASLFVSMLGGVAPRTIAPPTVLLCRGAKPAGALSSSLVRRLRKIRRIGPLGAVNGLRMRRWYGSAVSDELGLEDIRQACEKAGVHLVEISGFSHPDSQRTLADLDAHFAISLGNGLIPEAFFRLPRYGMINLHHELLPEYRGAQTALWQIHNGSRLTGFSIHEIDRRVDGGRILVREVMPILFQRWLRETIVQTACAVQRRSVERLFDVVADFERYRSAATTTDGGTLYTTPGAKAMLRIYRNHFALGRAHS